MTTFVFPFADGSRRRAATQRWSPQLLALLRGECRVVGRRAAGGGDMLPLAIRYRDLRGARSSAAAYVGDDSFMTSFWRVCATPGLVVEVVPLARVPAAGRHRRALAKEAESAIRRVLE